MNRLKTLALAAAMLLLPIAANAQPAYTAKSVHLRAGPARDYPVVAILGSGFTVDVQGCLRDYSWCDVVAGPNRGWVYAGNLVYYYQGANVPVISYGAIIGIGVVTFVIANYWHDHYVGRPWYRQMPQWSHRPPRAVVRPRPPQPGVHPGATQHPMPAVRPPQRQPNAGANPRPPQGPAHPGQAPRTMPAPRPPLQSPGAGVTPRQPQSGTQPGRAQGQTPGPAQGPRQRQ